MLHIDDVVVPVAADKARGPVRIDLQCPDLKFSGGYALLEALRNRDRIEQPIGSAFVGNVFRTIVEKDFAIDGVPIPVFGAAELVELCFSEICCFRHG